MKNVKVIGIAGLARSGKDTAAGLIFDCTPHIRIAFADPLKRMLSEGLNIPLSDFYEGDRSKVDDTYGVTLRTMMQTLGTEWGRTHVGEDVWIKAVEREISNYSTPLEVLVTDVRYENEAAWVRKHGKLVHVIGRGGIEGDHPSESGIDKLDSDLVLDNSGDIEYLNNQVQELILNKHI